MSLSEEAIAERMNRLNDIALAVGGEIVDESADARWMQWVNCKINDVTIRLEYEHDGKRVEARLVPPNFDYRTLSDSTPLIKFNPTRDVQALARDIQNRLLPNALSHYERAVRWQKQKDEMEAAKGVSEQLLIGAGAKKLHYGGLSLDSNRHRFYSLMTVSPDGKKVDINIHSISPEDAAAILRLLSDLG